MFMRLSGPHSRLTTTQKLWQCQELNQQSLGLQPGTDNRGSLDLDYYMFNNIIR
jgi:hypothetical protein